MNDPQAYHFAWEDTLTAKNWAEVLLRGLRPLDWNHRNFVAEL